MKGKQFNKNYGFTIVELVVVVVMIGIIAAIAVPSIIRSRASANTASAISALRVISQVQNHKNLQSRNYMTLGALAAEKAIDERFGGEDDSTTEVTVSNYQFKIVLYYSEDGVTTENYLLSAIPVATYSGTKRCGIDKASVIKCSTENTDQHFASPDELYAADAIGN
jgi:prepilin-type N-terminal cleavage/methylation domain-containing protein